jgi:uncharacterized cupredoxin-like copper-binding protein
MNSALKGALAVGALTLVLAVVLASCSVGGGGGGYSAGRGSSSTGKATTSGKSTTGASSDSGGKYGSSSSAAKTTTNGASNRASGGTLKTIVIKETEFKLSPSTVTLSKPGTYAFKADNKGSAEHNLEIEGEGVKSKGGEAGEVKLEKTLNPGQSGVLTVTFQEPGTYEMYCPVIGHRLAGMKGEVVVK